MADVKSLKRAVDILNLYTLYGAQLGVSEIAQKLSMNKSTVSRLVSTLESCNMLKRCSTNKKYRLGGQIIELSRAFLSSIDLKTAASSYIKELNERTKESILLHVIEGDKRYCIDWVEGSETIRRAITNDHIYGPLHAGAPGKLLLAYLPDEKINEIIDRTGLSHFTKNTITSKEELRKEIEKIRKKGISISKGEHIEFVCTISAPVRNYLGKVIAALSISFVIIRDTPELEKEYSELLKEVALKFSRELGYQD